MLVNLLLGAGNKDAAMTLALQARTGDSRNALSYKLEGNIDSAQGKHAEALKAYEHAHALSPGPAALIQIYGALVKLGRQGEADARVLAWLAKHPADVAPRLHLASSLLVRNLPKAAIQQYELVLQHEPDNVAALNDLAWSSQRLGLPQALGYAQRAYQLAPTNPAILDTLGWIYLEQGALARATPLLQEASTRAPAAADIHFHYGVLLARTGDKRAARRELQLALNNPALSNRSQAQAALAGL